MNARFLDYIPGGDVKLTLRPGQSFRWSHGGPTDEGFHAESRAFRFDGTFVYMEETTRGRGCDGRYSTADDFRCHVLRLRSNVTEYGAFPDWQRLSGSQRDYAAEAAGY